MHASSQVVKEVRAIDPCSCAKLTSVSVQEATVIAFSLLVPLEFTLCGEQQFLHVGDEILFLLDRFLGILGWPGFWYIDLVILFFWWLRFFGTTLDMTCFDDLSTFGKT